MTTLRSSYNKVWNRPPREDSDTGELPFTIENSEFWSGRLQTLHLRLERDGWKREGAFGEKQRVSHQDGRGYDLYLDEPGWSWQPTPVHPTLRLYYRGYIVPHGYTFEFRLEGSTLLDPEVDWATWDSKGDLLLARRGVVERYTLAALASGTPSFRVDLESLAPPARDAGPSSESR